MFSVRIRAIWSAVLFLACACPAATGVPPLSELLDQYTQALDSTQSMISFYESSGISSGYLPPLNMKHTNERVYERGQRRTDGQGRIYHQAYYWGYHLIKKRDVPEERARYTLSVASSDFQYGHSKGTRGQADGCLTYKEDRSPGWDNFRNESDAFFLGYLGVDVRIDRILRNARQISVRPQPEIINGSVCYVVKADTAYGDYTVWLDSAHGYQPARIEVSRGGDDIVNVTAHQPPPEKSVEGRDTLVIDNIAFKEVQGVWVPDEGRVKKHIEWPKHRFYTKNEIQFKITAIILNPDHDVLESFADPMENPKLDPELVNGTRIRLGNGRSKCVWRDGKVVDNAGKVVDVQAAESRTP
ncbi:MAG: hypothetical protein ACYTAS_09605 [Planctomycetota bacterium]|jgi:hypothetical protein